MASLKDKVALITGASSGIGEAIAVLMAERGASIALCGRNHDRLKAVSDTCKEVSASHLDNASRFIALAGDVTKSEVRKRLVEETVQRFGRLDILVANAGVLASNGSLEKETEENFDLQFDTNVKAVYFLIQEALPALERSKGNVVVVSSIVSEICSGALAIYFASKAAIDHLVRCLSLDLGRKDIRINTVNPTFVRNTRILHSLLGDQPDVEKAVDNFLDGKDQFHPLNGRCALPREIASVVAFLASSEAGMIQGQSLQVDGGVSCNSAILQVTR